MRLQTGPAPLSLRPHPRGDGADGEHCGGGTSGPRQVDSLHSWAGGAFWDLRAGVPKIGRFWNETRDFEGLLYIIWFNVSEIPHIFVWGSCS